MTTGEWLSQAQAVLEKAGISSARLDAVILLEDVMDNDRAHLLAHLDSVLTAKQQQTLDDTVQRRARHVPLAYIRHRVEFYGRTFYVDERVLVPRPETETIIEILSKLSLPRHAHIADIGTGSGALAITASLEMPDASVSGVDIDFDCIQVAKHNASLHKVDIRFLKGNLLAPLATTRCVVEVLLCNLPYVPEDHTINADASYEPKLALYGGSDGLNLYRKLFSKILSTRRGTQYIIAESLPEQHNALRVIAQHAGYRLVLTQDFVQLFQKA
jgi:release factor glutamine methyltransferase